MMCRLTERLLNTHCLAFLEVLISFRQRKSCWRCCVALQNAFLKTLTLAYLEEFVTCHVGSSNSLPTPLRTVHRHRASSVPAWLLKLELTPVCFIIYKGHAWRLVRIGWVFHHLNEDLHVVSCWVSATTSSFFSSLVLRLDICFLLMQWKVCRG